MLYHCWWGWCNSNGVVVGAWRWLRGDVWGLMVVWGCNSGCGGGRGGLCPVSGGSVLLEVVPAW